MARWIKGLMIAFVLVMILMACSFSHSYERNATVTKVLDDTIECEDEQGNLWLFYGDGFNKGDNIILIMSDNETVGITDDIILNVK